MNIRNWSYDTSSYIHEYTMHNEHIIFQSFVKIHKTRHSKTKKSLKTYHCLHSVHLILPFLQDVMNGYSRK